MVKGALLMNRDLTASSNDTSSGSRDLTMSSPLVNTTKEIVNITTFASEKAKALMKDRDLEDAALRIFVTPGGCAGYEYGMAIAETVEVSDKLIENNGLKIVDLAALSSSLILSLTISTICYLHYTECTVAVTASSIC